MIAAVAVDERTRGELGDVVLSEVMDNLWPGECQLCGRVLGAAAPALVVDVQSDLVATAALFHRGCRAPSWNDRGRVSATKPSTHSYKTKSFVMAVTDSRGNPVSRLTMLLNPSPQQVMLWHGGTGWGIGSMRPFRQFGLGSSGVDFVGNRPVAGARALLREGRDGVGGTDELVVMLRSRTWTVPVDERSAQLARESGGVVLAVNTELYPAQVLTLAPLLEAARTGKLLSGWIELAGGPTARPDDRGVVKPADRNHPRAGVAYAGRVLIDPLTVLDNIALAMERLELDISVPVSMEEDVIELDELAGLIDALNLGPCAARKVIAARHAAYLYSLMSPPMIRVRSSLRAPRSPAVAGCASASGGSWSRDW